MLIELLQAAKHHPSRFTLFFHHLGAFGLFCLAILDSSPIPTFGGTDVLTIILVAAGRGPWYEFAAIATTGSVIGAYITFKLARRAREAYVDEKQRKRPRLLKIFEKWGIGALAASAAVPFPFPTSVFFAAAGASRNYRTPRYLAIVTASRAVRYSAVAFIAHLYGRRIIRLFRHPTQHLGFLLVLALIFLAVIGAGLVIRRRVARKESSSSSAVQDRPVEEKLSA